MDSKPLRIALYVPALVGGGTERSAATLASGLSAKGCDVSLFVDFEAEANRRFVDAKVPIIPLSRSHARSVWMLSRHLARGAADVLLAFGGAADVKGVAAKLLAAKLVSGATLPIVLTYHGRGDIGTGRLGGMAFRLAPLLTRIAAQTVCVSESLVRHLVEDHRGTRTRISCIPNAIDVESAIAAPDEASLLARAPHIIAVGRLQPEKSYATLLRAFARLPAETRLTIFGEGSERAALLALSEELNVGARVSLPGYVDAPWPHYASARVFALSSLSEGFGNVVVEALASGLPVVATDCGGPREILDGGRYGTLVPVGDVERLAEGLAHALANPGDPRPRVDRASQYAVGQVADRYIAMIEHVLRSVRRREPDAHG